MLHLEQAGSIARVSVCYGVFIMLPLIVTAHRWLAEQARDAWDRTGAALHPSISALSSFLGAPYQFAGPLGALLWLPVNTALLSAGAASLLVIPLALIFGYLASLYAAFVLLQAFWALMGFLPQLVEWAFGSLVAAVGAAMFCLGTAFLQFRWYRRRRRDSGSRESSEELLDEVELKGGPEPSDPVLSGPEIENK